MWHLTSRTREKCACEEGFWKRRLMDGEPQSSVRKYISTVTERWICQQCLLRYSNESYHVNVTSFSVGLVRGSNYLRRKLNKIGIKRSNVQPPFLQFHHNLLPTLPEIAPPPPLPPRAPVSWSYLSPRTSVVGPPLPPRTRMQLEFPVD